MKSKHLLLSATVGLMLLGSYVGCLPADTGTTTGAAGTSGTAGTTGTVAGTTGSEAGTTGSEAGTTGSEAGTTGNIAGTTGNTAGTTGNTAGTTGNTAGTSGGGTSGGGTSGGGTTGAGGRGGAAGTNAAGTTGAGGRGGAAGTSAAGTTGAGGRGGAAGTGAAGTGSLLSVAATLDGQMLTGPCGPNTEMSVCSTFSGTCPDRSLADAALRGVKTTDRTVTLGGTAGVTYTIEIHVQGVVESRNYTGGTDRLSTGTSPNMDGWRMGGTPAAGNDYNVYMLRVTNPGSTTSTSYYLNSLDPPGVQNHTVYGLNYTTPPAGQATAFTAQGGATVRMVAADSNCSMIKNCGPNPPGNACPSPITIQNVEPTSVTKNASFNFNTAYNGQWIVLTVKNVTQN